VGILDHLTRTDRGIEFLEDLKGLGQIAPVAAVTLLVSLAGSIGCPWTAGFWSRWLIMLAANNVHLKSTASFFEPHGGIRFVILVGTIATIFMASMVIRIARETILESPLARTAPLRRRGPLIAGLMSAVTCLILGVVPDALLAPLRSIGTPREPRLEVPSKGSGKNRSVFRGRIRRLTDFEGSHCQARSARQVNDHFLISTKLACCTWQSSTRWAQFCPVWSGTSSPDYQPREDNPFILVDPNS
jgi:formate hydrogenlyase subunit 3/multisubunit Na+/H+ antiporter MnhD subunit